MESSKRSNDEPGAPRRNLGDVNKTSKGAGEDSDQFTRMETNPSRDDELMIFPFVLVVKTLERCPACIRFKLYQRKVESILPVNIEMVSINLGTKSYHKRDTMFMTSRGCNTVPSIFLTSKSLWDKYQKDQIADDELTSNDVAALCGIYQEYEEGTFKTWLSDGMNRLYNTFCLGGELSYLDSMMIHDMQYPLVKFRERVEEVNKSCRRHGKAYYTSKKSRKLPCSNS